MRRVYRKIALIALSGMAMTALSGCLGTGGSTSESGAGDAFGSAYVPAYPTEADSFEGATGDNNMSTASTITVGEPLQGRSIFPQGDYDWVKVELEAGVVYDLFATNLNETGDTYLYLYDDSGNKLDSNDDYIDYDSFIEFNATYTGTFYLKVRSYIVEEATSYELGVRVHIDEDNDGYSEPFDCNDNNDTIYPFATEIAGDGIDQDCSGVDAIANGTPDNYEEDDNFNSAKPMPETQGSYREVQHRNDIFSQMRTLHNTSDTDFYTVTIPAYSAAYVIEYAGYMSGNTLNSYEWYVYDENHTEINNGTPGVYELVRNDSSSEKTYYIEVRSNGSEIGWYAPALVHIGEDRDRDGYYTMDWDGDCNDANASIYPYANDDNDTDGIDMNCDGVDGYNSSYRS